MTLEVRMIFKSEGINLEREGIKDTSGHVVYSGTKLNITVRRRQLKPMKTSFGSKVMRSYR
jgi:hypothetical protein